MQRFVEVMARLRQDCPWDARQTHRSLVQYLIEETGETIEAIETGNADHLREELGDLLLQVVFHAIIAAENGDFTLDARGTLRAGDGKVVLGVNDQPIRVPDGASGSRLSINEAGQVTVQTTGGAARVVGTVQLARFTNDKGLERVGDTEFKASRGSGAAITGTAGATGFGSVVSGVLESSNVDLGSELSNLIMAQRGFSANARVMTATDELVDRINQMR